MTVSDDHIKRERIKMELSEKIFDFCLKEPDIITDLLSEYNKGEITTSLFIFYSHLTDEKDYGKLDYMLLYFIKNPHKLNTDIVVHILSALKNKGFIGLKNWIEFVCIGRDYLLEKSDLNIETIYKLVEPD